MAYVLRALTRCGAETVMIDQRAYPTVTGSLAACQDGAAGWISVAGYRRPVEGFCGYFLRPYPIPPRYHHGLTLHQVAAIDQMMLTLAETAPAHIAVVNRPSAMASNDSKPAQLAQLEDLGFLVPDTIVTNDREIAEDFWARHGTVVYESTSGIRSIASTLTTAHRDRLDRLATCPTQFQEFIPGDDYRVHVVGDETFATHIVSTANGLPVRRHAGGSADHGRCAATQPRRRPMPLRDPRTGSAPGGSRLAPDPGRRLVLLRSEHRTRLLLVPGPHRTTRRGGHRRNPPATR